MYETIYEAYDALQEERERERLQKLQPRNALQLFRETKRRRLGKVDGFQRIENCRKVMMESYHVCVSWGVE